MSVSVFLSLSWSKGQWSEVTILSNGISAVSLFSALWVTAHPHQLCPHSIFSLLPSPTLVFNVGLFIWTLSFKNVNCFPFMNCHFCNIHAVNISILPSFTKCYYLLESFHVARCTSTLQLLTLWCVHTEPLWKLGKANFSAVHFLTRQPLGWCSCSGTSYTFVHICNEAMIVYPTYLTCLFLIDGYPGYFQLWPLKITL